MRDGISQDFLKIGLCAGGLFGFAARATLPRPFQRLVIVVSCLQLLGGVYAPLQVVAWAAMLARYSQQDGLAEAARATFDGSRPCSMCVAISEAKQAAADQPETPAKQVEKPRLQWLEWALVDGVDLPVVRVVELRICWRVGALRAPTGVDGEPAVPPPRVLGA